jgi:hypothetical protein
VTDESASGDISDPEDLYASNLVVAQQFADLCTTLESPDTVSPWNYVAQEVIVRESLDVTLRRTWHLDSRILLDMRQDLGQRALIPLIPLNPASPSANKITIAALAAERTTDPVPARTLNSLTDSGSPGQTAWTRWLAVPMSAGEFTSSPVVNVLATSEYRNPVSGRFSLGELWPVGCMEIVFHGNTPFTAIAARFPEYATVDIVGIKCTVTWTQKADEISDLLNSESLKQAPDTPGVWRTFYKSVDNDCFNAVNGQFTELKSAIEQAASTTLGEAEQRKSRAIWSGGLDLTKTAFEKWTKAWNNNNPDAKQVKEAAEGLIKILRDGTKFVLPGKLSSEGNIEQANLVAALRESVDRLVRVDSVVAPFTSEREPSTQGRRSSLILALLGLVLLGSAFVDLRWLPNLPIFDWLPHTAPMPNKAVVLERANSLREPMVALLLIFPAALYGQFFQLRPTSLVGHRAQSATFAALSTLFALPIVPAAYLAAGGTLPKTSVVCLAIGIVALIAAVVVGLLFSGTALERVRTKALIKQIEAGSSEPVPASTRMEVS